MFPASSCIQFYASNCFRIHVDGKCGSCMSHVLIPFECVVSQQPRGLSWFNRLIQRKVYKKSIVFGNQMWWNHMKSLNSSTNGLVIGRTIILGPWQEHQKTLISNIMSTVCFYCWLYHVDLLENVNLWKENTAGSWIPCGKANKKKKNIPSCHNSTISPVALQHQIPLSKTKWGKSDGKNNKHQHININYRHL